MIKISKGNTKLGNIWNTSVRPILDCKKGVLCTKLCYAMKAWRQYPGVRNAWSHNSKEWKTAPKRAALSIVRAIKKAKKTPEYFRIHVAGDFMSQKHVDMWKFVARHCPTTKFRAFTKRWDFDFSDKPDNLIIGWSMWTGMKDTAPEGVRAWVQDGKETRIPKGTVECSSDCNICKICWDEPQDVWFAAH